MNRKSKKKYSQIRATLAIAKASLKATFRNPSSIIFGILFPFIFILAFGFLGDPIVEIEIGVEKTEYENLKNLGLFHDLEQNEGIVMVVEDIEDLENQLRKGHIDAILKINTKTSPISINIQTSKAVEKKGSLFLSIVEGMVSEINFKSVGTNKILEINSSVINGRKYKNIDFILPGQLGFALLTTGIFSTAFTFLILRQTLVLKRFFATPIRKSGIIIGEMIGRLAFAMMQASVLILVGHFLLGFTLVNGFSTFISMLIMSAIGLILFLGFGFLVSGIAKDQNIVPVIANLFTMPQFILGGTFFSIDTFPKWLQPFSKILPLRFLNDALRKIAFDGDSIFSVYKEVGAISIWAIVVYFLTIRVFRWED